MCIYNLLELFVFGARDQILGRVVWGTVLGFDALDLVLSPDQYLRLS